LERPNGSDLDAPPLPVLPPPTPETEAELERLLGHTEALLDREDGALEKLRSLPTTVRALVAAGGATLAVLGVYALMRRSDFSMIPGWQVALATVTCAVPLVALLWFSLAPLHRVEPRPEHAGALIGTGFALPFVWASLPPLEFARATPGATRHGCLVLGLLLGGAFLALLRALDRAADDDPRTLAMGAAAGGLVANLSLAFYCPEVRLVHLGLVHAPVGLVLLLLYRRIVSRRRPHVAATR